MYNRKVVTSLVLSLFVEPLLALVRPGHEAAESILACQYYAVSVHIVTAIEAHASSCLHNVSATQLHSLHSAHRTPKLSQPWSQTGESKDSLFVLSSDENHIYWSGWRWSYQTCCCIATFDMVALICDSSSTSA